MMKKYSNNFRSNKSNGKYKSSNYGLCNAWIYHELDSDDESKLLRNIKMIYIILMIRNKKLTQKQVILLLNKIKSSGKSIKELSQEYNLSLSTLYNIKNCQEHYQIGE